MAGAAPQACRLVVLAPQGAALPTWAWARTLEQARQDRLLWTAVEVFGGPDAGAALPAENEANMGMPVRLHPRTHDLSAALRQLQAAWATRALPGEALAWLVAGTDAPTGWVQPLMHALEGAPQAGTISPLVVDEALHHPFPHAVTPDVAVQPLSLWLARHAPADSLELGQPAMAAGVLRAQAWNDVLAAERDALEAAAAGHWSVQLSRRGWLHECSRQTAVRAWPAQGGWPDAAAEQAPQISSLLARAEMWAAAHPLTGLRYALGQVPLDHWRAVPAELAPQAMAAPAAPAVRLHLMHSWGGGLSKWVRDFCQADAHAGTGRGLILRSVGTYGAFAQRLELHADHDGGVPLQFWELGLPIHATALAHRQYRQIIDEIIERYGVAEVVVSSLIGHSLDALRTGLPTVLVTHDHYPYCITLYAHFEQECRQCDGGRLRACMQGNSGHRFFQGVGADDWEALRRAFSETIRREGTLLVAPSPSVAERWQALMPELQGMAFPVVGHGLDLPNSIAFEPPTQGPLRVVVMGRLSAEKGVDVLREAMPALLEFGQVMLLGCGDQADRLKSLPGVTVVEHYTHEELPRIVADWAPDVALLLSTVPETFSYALSELWHLQVPVLACANGALADRVQEGVNGFLTPAHAHEVVQRLRQLRDDRTALLRVKAHLQQQPARTRVDMLHEYRALMDDLPRRRPFSEASVDGHTPSVPAAPVPMPQGVERWLQVNPEATWKQAAQAFWAYTRRKALRSPRVGGVIKRLLGG